MCAVQPVTHVSGPDNVNVGAGDGNRTHVRSLGSFYSAIELRPLGSEPENSIGVERCATGEQKQVTQRVPLARASGAWLEEASSRVSTHCARSW
jgi:hypothetical protein